MGYVSFVLEVWRYIKLKPEELELAAFFITNWRMFMIDIHVRNLVTKYLGFPISLKSVQVYPKMHLKNKYEVTMKSGPSILALDPFTPFWT